MYEQNVLSGHNKVIQAHVQSRATGIEDKGHHVLRAVVGARPDLRIALSRVWSRAAFASATHREGSVNSQVDVPCSAVCRDFYFAGLRLLVSTVSHLHVCVLEGPGPASSAIY